MTNHKKGKEHWSVECKTIKEERDKLKFLLKEVYEMAGGYYANMDEIRDKIKKVIG